MPLLIHSSEKEMNRRKDMVGNLRSKANQVASALNMSNFANRDSLLGPEIKPDDAMNRVSGMDNQGIVGFQRQVMRGKLCYVTLSLNHIKDIVFCTLLSDCVFFFP